MAIANEQGRCVRRYRISRPRDRGPVGRNGRDGLCAKAMARDEVIGGWKDPRRYTRARKILLARGVIKLVSRACRDALGHWIPAQYKFTRPGASIANITYTLPSCSPTSITSS